MEIYRSGISLYLFSLLLYLLCSDDRSERETGVEVVSRIRARSAQTQENPSRRKKPKKSVRPYLPRELNWNAQCVADLVDLSAACTEPPLTLSLSDEDVQGFVDSPFKPLKYKSNSQFVERQVKDTSAAVSKVTGEDRQDGLTLNKCASRKKVPSIRKKTTFK